MICPNCGGKIQVVETRHDLNSNETYRQKECLHCRHIIYSVEYEVFSESIKDIWKSLERRSQWHRKTSEKHKCFGRYLDISPACAECQWKKECLEKSKSN